MESVDGILTYWFGTNPDSAALAKDRADLWWSKNAESDREIRQRFAGNVQLAAEGKLDAWLVEPRGRLAMIILTDQFPAAFTAIRRGRLPSTPRRWSGLSTAFHAASTDC